MMRGAPDLVIVVLLCVLVLTVKATAGTVTIHKCESGSITQDENTTPAYLTCGGFTDTDNVTWTVANQNTSTPAVITCMPNEANCNSEDPRLNATVKNNQSFLAISGNYRIRAGNDSITCRAANQTASCSFVVTTAARLSNCDVKLNKADWIVTGKCRFEGVYSSNGVYTCTWHQILNGQLPGQPINGVVNKSMTMTSTSYSSYYDGTCTLTTPLSPQNKEGLYTYTAGFNPGSGNRPAEGSFLIQSPGDPVTNCPQYVYEGQSLSCHCLVNRSSQGFPPPITQWQGSSPGQQLDISNVTRNDSGRVFTCSVSWGPADGAVKSQTEYILNVADPPSFPPVISGYNGKSGVTAGNLLTLTCTVTGGRPLVTAVNVSCGPDVQGDVGPMNVTNTSVSVTFTIHSIEARHDGTECVCTGDWEVHREAYNVSASIQLRVMETFMFPLRVVTGVVGGSVVVIILVVVVVVVVVRSCRSIAKPHESEDTDVIDTAGTDDDYLESFAMPTYTDEDGGGYATVTEATSHRASSSDYGYAVPDMSVYTQPSGTSDRDRKTSTVMAGKGGNLYAEPDVPLSTQLSRASDRNRQASTVMVGTGGNLYAEPDVPLSTQLSRASDRNRQASTVMAGKGGNLYAEPDVPQSTQLTRASDRNRQASTVMVGQGDNLYAEPDVPQSTQLTRASDRNRQASTVMVGKGGNLYAEPDVPQSTQLTRASDRNRQASTVTVGKGGNLYAEPDVPLSTQTSGAPVQDSRTPTITLRENGSLYSVMDIVSRVTVSIPSPALETPDDPATHTYAQVDRKRSKSTSLDVYAQVNKATRRNTTAATEVNKGLGAHEQNPEEIVKPTLKPRISVKPKLNK